MKRYLITVIAILFALSGLAFAEDTPDLQPGVARISLIHGEVSVQRGDSGDWVAATLNTPLVPGDQVSTGSRSRAEIQLDSANVLRLSADSTAKIVDLTRTKIQVQVGQGLANYDVLKGSEADAEVDTLNVAIRPLQEGSYRILVAANDQTQVIVRKGEAEISTSQGSTRVAKGEQITVQGTDNPQYRTASAPEKDDWDRWNSDRDGLIRRAESWRHTNGYYTGSEDLDAYGHWDNVPDYGSVWVPAVGPGWAPYRAGRWVWEPYYGWTWVSYEPWGWAPYHYGRWFVYGSSWCWWPGPVAVYPAYYPVWSPAYVSFFGFGRHFGFGVGFGFGSVGWLPIGPGDYYYPWYGRRVNVVNVTNITNITNINNIHNVNGIQPVGPIYRGRGNGVSNLRLAMNDPRLQRSVSTMPANNFGKGRVPGRQPGIDSASLRQGGAITGRMPVVPTRESLRPTDKTVRPMNNRLASNQRFFSKSQPASSPKPFKEQVSQLRQMIDKSPRQQPTANRSNTLAGNGQSTPFNRANTLPERATKPLTNSSAAKAAVSANQNANQVARNQRPGWRSFGQSSGSQSSQDRTSQSGRTANQPTRSAAPASRETSPTRSATPASRSGDSNRSGWHSFSGGGRTYNPSQGSAGNRGQSSSRDSGSTRFPQRNNTPAASRGDVGSRNQGGDNWHRFTPPSQQRESAPRSMSEPRSMGSRSAGSGDSSGWRQFPSRSESQGSYDRPSRTYGGRSSYGDRPPLDLRQPIVTPRSSSPYSGPRDNGGPRGGGGYGNSGGSHSYERPSGGYSGGHPGGGYSGGGGSHGGGQQGGGRPSGSGGGGSHSSSHQR